MSPVFNALHVLMDICSTTFQNALVHALIVIAMLAEIIQRYVKSATQVIKLVGQIVVLKTLLVMIRVLVVHALQIIILRPLNRVLHAQRLLLTALHALLQLAQDAFQRIIFQQQIPAYNVNLLANNV